MKDFENTPYRENMRRKYFDGRYVYWKNYMHKIGSRQMYTVINHICIKFEGNHVNKAFAYYCSLVPKYMQQYFWDNIEDFDHCSWRCENRGHYIDRDRNIRKQKKEYREQRYEYVNYKSFKETKFIYENKSNSKYGRKLPPKEVTEYSQSYDKRYYEGSKGFKRIQHERRKQARLSRRYWEAEENAKVYNMLTYKEQLKSERAEEDERIRDSHGFNKNSFIGIEYHGRKRKRDKKKNQKKNHV